MKFLCAVIGALLAGCLAMTTPTMTTTMMTTTMTTMPTEDFMTEMDKCPSKPFTANCTTEEYSDWMGTCMWYYKGNFVNRFKTMMTEAKNIGCMTPTMPMMKYMTKRMTEMMDSPFVKNIPEMPCGFCGRKMKCCNKGTNFWMQSYTSESCDKTGTPCVIEPMTTADFTYMHEKYPTATFASEDTCSYDTMIMVAMNKMKTSKFWPMFKPLMCQMFGQARPIVNCTMFEGKCMCCCGGFMWSKETKMCVPVPVTHHHHHHSTTMSEWMC